jgi:hypothetical protein
MSRKKKYICVSVRNNLGNKRQNFSQKRKARKEKAGQTADLPLRFFIKKLFFFANFAPLRETFLFPIRSYTESLLTLYDIFSPEGFPTEFTEKKKAHGEHREF